MKVIMTPYDPFSHKTISGSTWVEKNYGTIYNNLYEKANRGPNLLQQPQTPYKSTLPCT